MAIRKAARGESYFSQSLSPYLKSALDHQKNGIDRNALSLTSRELEILKLIREGWRNKEIAESLGITKRTVDYHVGNLLSKLDVKSRIEAVLRYKKR